MYVRIDGITACTDEFDTHNIILHVRLAWEDEEWGFGLIDISQDRNGTCIDSENMNAEFVKRVLCSFIGQAEVKGE